MLSQKIDIDLTQNGPEHCNSLCSVEWQRQAKPGDFARFARTVFDCAQENDVISQQLLRQCAQEITLLLAALARHQVPALAIMGSIGLHIRPWLTAAWQQRLTPPSGDALDGVRLIACHNLMLYPHSAPPHSVLP